MSEILRLRGFDLILYVKVVRADMKELVDMDLKGAVYGYTPFCNSRPEMEGFRFWNNGYWKDHLDGKPYHIRYRERESVCGSLSD